MLTKVTGSMTIPPPALEMLTLPFDATMSMSMFAVNLMSPPTVPKVMSASVFTELFWNAMYGFVGYSPLPPCPAVKNTLLTASPAMLPPKYMPPPMST